MTSPMKVFIDTSELFPFTIMDVLLTLAEDFFFTWVWTDELLDEWERVIVREGQRSAASARSVTDAVRMHFASGRLDPAVYRSQVTDDLSPDPDDRVHAAACLSHGVAVLLTRNIRHYRCTRLTVNGVRVMTADNYLCELLSVHTAEVVNSLVKTANARRRPPMTPLELTERLRVAGTPLFATRVRDILGGHRGRGEGGA